MTSLFDAFSFDMLQALVQEMNYWKESPKEVLKWMNIKLGKTNGRQDNYLVKQLVVAGEDMTQSTMKPTWAGSPATAAEVQLDYYKPKGWGLLGATSQLSVYFSPTHHLVTGNITSGEFLFVDEDRKHKAILVRYDAKDPLDMAARLTK